MITYTWGEFNRDVREFPFMGTSYTSVYGVPRGGIPLALAFSQKLNIPMVGIDSVSKDTLICDDIIDSGATRSRFINNDFLAIHKKKGSPIFANTFFMNQISEWIVYPWEAEESQGEDIVRRMLQFIGEDPNRPGLKDTPKRVVKMWQEVFRGYREEATPDITVLDNDEDGVAYHDMVIDAGYFFSHCEHHLATFFGDYYFGYIPDKKVMGLSKIGRLIDHYSARLQIAERLVHQVADHIQTIVKPTGLILVMQGRHLCKEMRGLRKFNSPAEVIAVRGCFLGNEGNCKEEFLSRIPKIKR